MKYRIMQNQEGDNDVEAQYPAALGNRSGSWSWVATFKSIDEAKRVYPGAELPSQCDICLEEVERGHDVCESCCEHGDTDDHGCLDCGKDLTEDRMAAAYDRAKDARKYGDS